MNDLTYVCAPSPLQYAVASSLARVDHSFYEHLSLEYSKKRDCICEALARTNVLPHVPQGAYYVFADVSSLPGKGSKGKAMFLLEQTGVASVPEDAFFHNGGRQGPCALLFCKDRTRTAGSAQASGTTFIETSVECRVDASAIFTQDSNKRTPGSCWS